MQKKNKALQAAQYQKAMGVKLGIEAIYEIMDAAVWNSANELGLSEEQALKIGNLFKSECERLMCAIGDARTVSGLLEMSEYVTGKAMQCRERMEEARNERDRTED